MGPTTESVDAAARIREDAEAAYSALRSSPTLNAAAIKANLARRYVDAKAKMDKLAGDSMETRDTRLRSLRAKAFGIDDLANTPADRAALAVSYRDAQDRAAALDKPEQALALLERANGTGDELLARAIAQRAFDEAYGGQILMDQGWDDVLGAYLVHRSPSIGEALSTLVDDQRTPTNASSMFAFILPVPFELGTMRPYRIAELAASDMPAA